MTIEVHQLLIRSQVGPNEPAPRDEPPAVDVEQLREQVLAACKAWLIDRLQDLRER